MHSLLNFVGMGGLTLTQKTIIVAIAAVTVLVGKTALSALMAGRILRFLANRQADVSVRLARDFLSRPLIDRNRRLQAWSIKARELIDRKQQRLDPTSPAFKAHVGRLNLDRAKIARLLKAQEEWLTRTMRTSETGVLQVALAVVGPGVAG